MNLSKPGLNLRGAGIGSLDLAWLPARRGLTLYAPFVYSGRMYSIAQGKMIDLSTETVDADGRYPGRTGLITPAVANTARCSPRQGGMLIEGARTNFQIRSSEFDNAGWTKGNCNVFADAATSPAGAADADKVVEDGILATHNVREVHGETTNGTAYAWSVFAKREGRHIRLELSSTRFPGTPFANFNLLTGAVESHGNTDARGIEPVGNGWYRCWITATANVTAGSTDRIHLLDDSFSLSYTGDSASGAYLWGAQYEASASPSSYIPTAGASVARAADDLRIDNTGEVHCKAAAGTILVAATPEFDIADVPAAYGRIVEVRVADNSNGVGFHWDGPAGAWQAYVRSGGATVATLNSSTNVPARGVTNVLALTWQANDFRLYTQGVLDCTPDTAGAAPAAVPTAIRVGQSRLGTQQAFASIAHILISSAAWTADEILRDTRAIQKLLA